MEARGAEAPALVEVRQAAVGWKARACVARSAMEDRSRWRPTKRWAVRAVGRNLQPRIVPVGPDDDEFDGPDAA